MQSSRTVPDMEGAMEEGAVEEGAAGGSCNSFRRQLESARHQIIDLLRERERSKKEPLLGGGLPVGLRRQGMAFFCRHRHRDDELYDDEVEQEADPALPADSQMAEQIQDLEPEEFLDLTPFLLVGDEGNDRLLDEDVTEADPSETHRCKSAERDLDHACSFCDAKVTRETESSHYGSCPEYNRWSGADTNDSFFYQPPPNGGQQ